MFFSLDEDPESSPAAADAFVAKRFDEERLNKVTTPKGTTPHPTEIELELGRGLAKPRVETEKIRCRSRSENIPSSLSSSSNFFEPLDISFEEDKSFDDNWTPWKQNGHYLHSPGK